MDLSINHLLLLSISLFCVGMFGVLTRRNAILLFLSVEVMLNSGLLALLGFSGFHRSLEGAVLAFFILIIVAVESVVGLTLILLLKRLSGNIDIFKQTSV